MITSFIPYCWNKTSERGVYTNYILAYFLHHDIMNITIGPIIQDIPAFWPTVGPLDARQ